ncbi:unnamed protein product [Mucor hiemalis]
MDSVKSKRFSFAGFSSGLSRSLSFSNHTKSKKEDVSNIQSLGTPQQQAAVAGDSEDEHRRNRRAQKSKSLYIKSFDKKPSATSTSPTSLKYDASEAKQLNGKEIRNSIRRSLSAVLYASPHSAHEEDKGSKKTNNLVPVLVTPGLSDSLGGILIDDGTKNKVMEDSKEKLSVDKKKKKSVEYDNSLEVFSTKDDKSTTILWQGYGYTIAKEDQEEVASEMITNDTVKDLELRFEREIWESYRGLIHPLHLFQENDLEINKRGRWAGLSVNELRRYYDNYGSMMLKIRETRMLEQQKHYQMHAAEIKNEWIIPNVIAAQDNISIDVK